MKMDSNQSSTNESVIINNGIITDNSVQTLPTQNQSCKSNPNQSPIYDSVIINTGTSTANPVKTLPPENQLCKTMTLDTVNDVNMDSSQSPTNESVIINTGTSTANSVQTLSTENKLCKTDTSDSSKDTIMEHSTTTTNKSVITNFASSTAIVKRTNQDCVNDFDTSSTGGTTTLNSSIYSYMQYTESTRLMNFIYEMTLQNNPIYTYNSYPNFLYAGNSTSTTPAATSGNTMNNHLSYQDSSTINALDSNGSPHGIDDTNAGARNSTSTKPAEASGITILPYDPNSDAPFKSFEFNLHTLFLFVKETVIHESKTILASPKSNYRRVVLQNIKSRLEVIKKNDFMLNINMITCALYSVKKNTEGIALESIYDIMDTNGTMYKYTAPSESAHRVDFSRLGMKNIEAVQDFLRKIGKYKLNDPQGLKKFADDMKLDVSDENSSNYLSVRKAFQDKYGIYMAFIEGNHRMTTAALIIRNIPISSDIFSVDYMNDIEDISTFHNMFQQSYTAWIHTNYDCSLPNSAFMVKLSSNINLQQEMTFGAVFSDIINTCKSIYDDLKQSNQDIFVTL